MGFNAKQVQQLLLPINPTRVLKDGKGYSHVSQQDVTAHLIRVLGFGNFDTEVLNVECVFETNRTDKDGKPSQRWDVCYKALVRLTIKDENGVPFAHYDNGSMATAENQKRGDAHDLSFKSAISLSVKRAAINLGDNMGLSLYNRGQLSALVKGTLVMPTPEGESKERPKSLEKDVQEGVEQQVAMGNDETPTEADEEVRPVVPPVQKQIPEGAFKNTSREKPAEEGTP